MSTGVLSRGFGPAGRLRELTASQWVSGASCAVWAFFVVNFSALQVDTGDGTVQYQFVQRLFGDRSHAGGYFFGLGLAEAPFYGLGKLLELAGITTIAGQPTRQATIALALGLLTTFAWPLLSPILRGLGLPQPGLLILAAVLGTPLFFYATFKPWKDHALDALLFTACLALVYRYFSSDAPRRQLVFAIGGVLGASVTVRYINGAEGVALVLVLVALRRWRHAIEVTISAAAVSLALFAVPWALGASVFSGGDSPDSALTFAPLNPLRMLFTNHRGYFVWSPVAALGCVGFLLLFKTRPAKRIFLAAAGAMGLGIIASYALVVFWDGTWSFSQRFFTPLFPLVAIGLGGLAVSLPRLTAVAAAVACAWSLLLAFNLEIIGGPQYLNTIPGGASDVAAIPIHSNVSIGAYVWGLRHRSLAFR